MISARIRQFGQSNWTYITIHGQDESIVSRALIGRMNEADLSFHLQIWDDAEEEWVEVELDN